MPLITAPPDLSQTSRLQPLTPRPQDQNPPSSPPELSTLFPLLSPGRSTRPTNPWPDTPAQLTSTSTHQPTNRRHHLQVSIRHTHTHLLYLYLYPPKPTRDNTFKSPFTIPDKNRLATTTSQPGKATASNKGLARTTFTVVLGTRPSTRTAWLAALSRGRMGSHQHVLLLPGWLHSALRGWATINTYYGGVGFRVEMIQTDKINSMLKSADVKTILKTGGSSVKEVVNPAPDKSNPASTTLSRSPAWGQA
ncbi:hypothetical protein Q7P36_003803 [Cladosporium allicinum]